jgi:hypothetical protein
MSVFDPKRTFVVSWDTSSVEKQTDPLLGSLTTALLRLYLAFAGASAVMLIWLMLRVLSYHFASEGQVLPPPPTALLVTPIILMFMAKIALAWAYRRDVRLSQRST